MGGSAFVTGSIVAPGVIRQTGTYHRMTFGELDGSVSARGERLRDLCAAAGLEGVLSLDIRVPLWEKFIVLVPLSGLNALTRVPLGKYRDDPDLFALLEASLRETVAVGLAEGIRLAPDTVSKSISMIRAMSALSHDLDGQRPAVRQASRTAMVRRQGGRTWPPSRHPNPGERLNLRGIETLCERATSIGYGRGAAKRQAMNPAPTSGRPPMGAEAARRSPAQYGREGQEAHSGRTPSVVAGLPANLLPKVRDRRYAENPSAFLPPDPRSSATSSAAPGLC